MEKQEELRVRVVQSDIIWENKEANLNHYIDLLSKADDGKTDIILLPEMFSTGFSMNAKQLAENNDGPTMKLAQSWAKQYNAAIIGSFIAQEDGLFYNRGFAAMPNGKTYFYDKRHLFIGGEKQIFTPGNTHLTIAYKGWNIALSICYDLRFPVWLRNKDCAYDLMLCMAEWPSNRQYIFEHLLIARAIENQSYVCACNRVGVDGNLLSYIGGSVLIDYKGKVKERCTDNVEEIRTFTLLKYPLESHREKVPVWKDGDSFYLA